MHKGIPDRYSEPLHQFHEIGVMCMGLEEKIHIGAIFIAAFQSVTLQQNKQSLVMLTDDNVVLINC